MLEECCTKEYWVIGSVGKDVTEKIFGYMKHRKVGSRFVLPFQVVPETAVWGVFSLTSMIDYRLTNVKEGSTVIFRSLTKGN